MFIVITYLQKHVTNLSDVLKSTDEAKGHPGLYSRWWQGWRWQSTVMDKIKVYILLHCLFKLSKQSDKEKE